MESKLKVSSAVKRLQHKMDKKNDGEDDKDPWLAADKLYHVLFCLSLSLLFSTLASLTRHPLLRRNSILIGSTLSLAAGAAKEVADHLGLFPSAGASAKDCVADVIGVLIAALVLSLWKYSTRYDFNSGQPRWVSAV